MIIKFSFPIYETIWSNEVDQLLSFNYDIREWTVKSLNTGKIRTHKTSISIKNTSLEPIQYSNVGQDKIERYFKSLGINDYVYY